MKAIRIAPLVYIVLGVDENEHDQVLAVYNTYDEAKRYCINSLVQLDYYDVWIEKHFVS